ncbi:MAG TPA: alpha/beta hydrolase [Myxococcota bacterium]|jgi:pimeloyl-ACP methyl ester carboxylesterase|nr:alpha/beta hydrolase [Myxococcota bacterium]
MPPGGAGARPEILARRDGARLAYRRTPGGGVGVVFLPGLRSDMEGTKALALEGHCARAGRPFLRFDYFGHGASSGDFREGTIGRFLDDTLALLDARTEGRQVLVGSSMGGWLMLLAALARPERVAGLVGVAPAPDFTEDVLAGLDAAARRALDRDGVYLEPSPYSDEPTPITRALLEEARAHLLLARPIPFRGPVRILQGLADPDVPWQKALRLAEALASDDVAITLVKGGDHRLSTPADLARLASVTETLCRALELATGGR